MVYLTADSQPSKYSNYLIATRQENSLSFIHSLIVQYIVWCMTMFRANLLESSPCVGEPRRHLCKSHSRHDGQHNLFALGRVRVLDVLQQPRLQRRRRFATQRLRPRPTTCCWWRHDVSARWRHVETATAATTTSVSISAKNWHYCTAKIREIPKAPKIETPKSPRSTDGKRLKGNAVQVQGAAAAEDEFLCNTAPEKRIFCVAV